MCGEVFCGIRAIFWGGMSSGITGMETDYFDVQHYASAAGKKMSTETGRFGSEYHWENAEDVKKRAIEKISSASLWGNV